MATGTIFKLKRTSQAGKQPDVESLAIGELALNMADARLFYKDASDNIKEISAEASLTTLLDVDLTGLQNKDLLVYNSNAGKWIVKHKRYWHTNGTSLPTDPKVGDEFYDTQSFVLYKYLNDGTSDLWLDISTDTTLAALTLADATDVDFSAVPPLVGQHLEFDGTNWIPGDAGTVDGSGAATGIAPLPLVTVGASPVVCDTLGKTAFVSAKYLVTAKNGIQYSYAEVHLLNKGGVDVEMTEFGNLGEMELLTLDASFTDNNVILTGTSTDEGTVVELTRFLQGV